jgi:hypothetical protein
MIYIPSLIKIDSDFQKLMGREGGGDSETQGHTDSMVI